MQKKKLHVFRHSRGGRRKKLSRWGGLLCSPEREPPLYEKVFKRRTYTIDTSTEFKRVKKTLDLDGQTINV